MRESIDESDLQQMMEGLSSLETQSSGSQVRMMNRDGSFNSGNRRVAWHDQFSYIGLLTMSWPRFVLTLVVDYCSQMSYLQLCFSFVDPRRCLVTAPIPGSV